MFSPIGNLSKGLYYARQDGCFSKKKQVLTVFNRAEFPLFAIQPRTKWNWSSAFCYEICYPQEMDCSKEIPFPFENSVGNGIKWRYVHQPGYWEGEKRKFGFYDENWNEVVHFRYYEKITFPRTKPRTLYFVSAEIGMEQYHFFYITCCTLNYANIMVCDQQFRRIFHTSVQTKGIFVQSVNVIHVAQELSFPLMSILISLALFFHDEAGKDDLSITTRVKDRGK